MYGVETSQKYGKGNAGGVEGGFNNIPINFQRICTFAQ
jgi:hypothetical protein